MKCMHSCWKSGVTSPERKYRGKCRTTAASPSEKSEKRRKKLGNDAENSEGSIRVMNHSKKKVLKKI